MYKRLLQWALMWSLAYGGVIMAMEGMREMVEASNRQSF